MIVSLVQFDDGQSDRQGRGVAAITSDGARRVVGVATTLELADLAIQSEMGLAALAETRLGEPVDLANVRLLSPIDHPDDAHLLVSGPASRIWDRPRGVTRCTARRRKTPIRPIR